MAHYEPLHQDLCCLQIQLFSSLVLKELQPFSLDKNILNRMTDVNGSNEKMKLLTPDSVRIKFG